MKVKRMGITEILRRIWLFSANKIKALNLLVNNQLNSSLRHIIVKVGFFFQLFVPTKTYLFWISGRRKLLRAPPPPKVTIPPIKTKDINTAARVAETKKQGRIGLERNLKKAGLITKKKGPASIHRKLQRSSKRSKKLSKNAMRIVDTSANLVEGYVNKKEIFFLLYWFFLV